MCIKLTESLGQVTANGQKRKCFYAGRMMCSSFLWVLFLLQIGSPTISFWKQFINLFFKSLCLYPYCSCSLCSVYIYCSCSMCIFTVLVLCVVCTFTVLVLCVVCIFTILVLGVMYLYCLCISLLS